MTLKELARILNVSVSTVSKALRNSPEISPDTIQKVKELAKLNHYVPNTLAQNLKGRKTKTIGVVIPSILPQFFAKALHGIETKASELGYGIIICISNESLEKEKQSLKTLVNGRVDGLIVSLSRETQASMDIEHVMDLKNYKIPLVLFDRVLDAIECDKVSINDSLQAEQATMELYKSGCRQIAYVSGIPKTSVNDERLNGYKEALKRVNLKEQIIQFEESNFQDKKIQKLLKDGKLDGILASDELSGIKSMKAGLSAGFSIPNDFSVIGFTNGIMGEQFIPSLTVVDQHAEEQGKLALETMVDRIEEKLPPEKFHYKLDTSIIRRGSTKN